MSLNEWKEMRLEDVCSRITDGAHFSPIEDPSGLPMASVKDLTRFGINFDSCRTISDVDFENLVQQGCAPEENDVLIAKDGNSSLDTVCVYRQKEKVVLLSSIAISRPLSPTRRSCLSTTLTQVHGGSMTISPASPQAGV